MEKFHAGSTGQCHKRKCPCPNRAPLPDERTFNMHMEREHPEYVLNEDTLVASGSDNDAGLDHDSPYHGDAEKAAEPAPESAPDVPADWYPFRNFTMCLLAAFAQRASLTRDDYCALCEILTDKRFDPRDITTRTMQGLKYHVNSRLPQVRSRKVPLTLEQRVRVRQRTVPGKGRRRVKIKPTVKLVTKK